ncbi:MAG TPA: DUF1127 domain-containing protein [Aestuariivirgaceae bacterium]|jgi:uncharacterized protein YjiS (DUF1127 family)
MSNHFTAGGMAYTEARQAAFGAILSLISSAIEGIVTRMKETRTRRMLLELDDHMLNDIGISRIDLRAGRLAEMRRANWSAKGHPFGM